MAEAIRVVNEDVQYICGEFESSDQFGDLILEDGTRAVIVNGNLFTLDGQTLVLQDDDSLTQYCIDDFKQLSDVNDEVHCTDADDNSRDVVYIQNDDMQRDETLQYHLADCNTSVDGPVELKMLKLEGDQAFGEIVDLDEFLKSQGMESEATGVEYTIVSDSELEFQQGATKPRTDEMLQFDGACKINDGYFSNIRGRNLLTGQPITLSRYMYKLRERITNEKLMVGKKKPPPSMVNHSLNTLLHRKFTLGRSTDGKKIVGKIINIKRREEERKHPKADEKKERVPISDKVANDFATTSDHQYNSCQPGDGIEEIDDTLSDTATSSIAAPGNILVHERVVGRESFETISKIMSGLMNMDSVKRKLLNKNIVIKLVEKIANRESKIFYSSGCMMQEYRLSDIDDRLAVETSRFVPDANTKKAIFEPSTEPTANVTITVTEDETGAKVTKVSLDPSTEHRCTVCGKSFLGAVFLKLHTKSHSFKLESEALSAARSSPPHRHVEGMFECAECNRKFPTSVALRRHISAHFNRASACKYCDRSFATAQQLKSHVESHGDYGPEEGGAGQRRRCFGCSTCGRKFSRQSNLQRHLEIHRGDGARFTCNVCGCAYHYASSLTRHVVQNHVQGVDAAAGDESEVMHVVNLEEFLQIQN
ncbi:uncharacterized protein LOC132706331 [Cylas formicarius]|uniref:uncharacterized protein LOC132706331 n=1 Tax=Cylas formicarius TaxID=197179 RepID=UPI0029588BF9|nr:uncharacterized protein LOC132706331 [Cylas formicarius]XP_060533592.1 uncharacterized protein LOC132706331 [Cylas formicarius]XP_060533593.1 uncharacterized protein LOC132706331 [Cylas formicarius]XP_060533594.1 uncharacterized protein LOC132706331 [Cylas formicarius]